MKVCLEFRWVPTPQKNSEKQHHFPGCERFVVRKGRLTWTMWLWLLPGLTLRKSSDALRKKIAKTQGSSAPNITRGTHNQRMKILKPTVALLLVWKLAHHWHMPFGQILLLQSHQVFFVAVRGTAKKGQRQCFESGWAGRMFQKKAAGIWAYIFKWGSYFRWLKEIDPERGFKTWCSACFLRSFSDTVVTAAVIGNLPFLIGNFEVSWHTNHVYPSNVCHSVLAADLAESQEEGRAFCPQAWIL